MVEEQDPKKSANKKLKITVFFLFLIFLLTTTIGLSLTYLNSKSNVLTNTFIPSTVACQVVEDFNGQVKSNINVENTGDTKAFIRVKLISYRVNSDEERIGGTAYISDFTLGEGWFQQDGFYYYSYPVAANEKPSEDLVSSKGITMIDFDILENDLDGGKQVIEVMAEAIQSDPLDAVLEAWKVQAAGDEIKNKEE